MIHTRYYSIQATSQNNVELPCYHGIHSMRYKKGILKKGKRYLNFHGVVSVKSGQYCTSIRY